MGPIWGRQDSGGPHLGPNKLSNSWSFPADVNILAMFAHTSVVVTWKRYQNQVNLIILCSTSQMSENMGVTSIVMNLTMENMGKIGL